MTDNTENLILEHLRSMRGKIDQMADDLTNIKLRMTSIEGQFAGLHNDNAIVHARIDSVEKRLERIDRRLELTSV